MLGNFTAETETSVRSLRRGCHRPTPEKRPIRKLFLADDGKQSYVWIADYQALSK